MKIIKQALSYFNWSSYYGKKYSASVIDSSTKIQLIRCIVRSHNTTRLNNIVYGIYLFKITSCLKIFAENLNELS